MAPPVLGLLTHRSPSPAVGRLLTALARWSQPRVANPAYEQAAAWLATSPQARGIEAALRTGRPVAVHVGDDRELRTARALRASLLLTDRGELVRGAAPPLLIPSVKAVDPALLSWQPPFVRERRRQAAGLPHSLCVDLRPGSPSPLPEALASTALAVCAVAVVGEDLLEEALAWGTPCVVDAAVAARFGLRDGVEVRISEVAGAAAAAGDLANDATLAASLSQGARRTSVHRHHLRRLSAVVAQRLRLVSAAAWSDRLGVELDMLDTPALARIRIRVDRLMLPLQNLA